MKKRIGFFGGSFDPIHLGHINLAVQILEIHSLDHILFCPAQCSPHKENTPPNADFEKRKEMVELAIMGYSYFSLTTIQENMGKLSFHIDTLKLVKEKDEYKNTDLFLVLAEDSIEKFYLWKDVYDLCALANPLFGTRKDYSIGLNSYPDENLLPIIKNGLTKTKVMEISATDVRDRLKKSLYCQHLLPTKVLDYIYKHDLYL